MFVCASFKRGIFFIVPISLLVKFVSNEWLFYAMYKSQHS